MKALIIDEPWISLILNGEKTWEMRKMPCHLRGEIGLIRKGSGTVVGLAQLVDARPPLLTLKDYAAAEPFHRIPPGRQERAFGDGWRHPWVLANARRLPQPVPYEHPPGAVIWVNLEPQTVARLGRGDLEAPAGPSVAAPDAPPAPVTDTMVEPVRLPTYHNGTKAYVRLNGANIRNHHIYLASVLDLFPAEAIGGANKAEASKRRLRVTFVPGPTVDTDIDGTKNILRSRGAVRAFFERAGAQDGDTVEIERTGPYDFTFSLQRPA